MNRSRLVRRLLAGGIALAAAAALMPTSAGAQDVAEEPPLEPGTYVDQPGLPYVVDPLPPERPGGDRSREAALPGPFPDNQTFLLHSRASSTKKIYLDFNGHTAVGTHWSDPPGIGGPGGVTDTIVASAYDTEGGAGTFTPTERDVIQSIYLRVSEDFAPFDVDVTTEEPTTAQLDRTTAGDTAYGMRAVITNLNGLSGDCECGGIAYIGAFDWIGADHLKYQPAWIFSGALTGAKDLAEATSHELGHTFGLAHDGQKDPKVEYYSPEDLWAPIMGSAYDAPVSQWSRGEYERARNYHLEGNPPVEVTDPLQDDLLVIASHGATLLPDDHGDTNAAATALGASPWSTSGTIGTREDHDRFSFTVTRPGTVHVDVLNAPVSPNLDIRLAVRTPTGDMAIDDPVAFEVTDDVASGLDGTVEVHLAEPGTYYVGIDGVGQGDPLTGGYSDYGSLGRYSLTGSFTPDPALGDFNADGLTEPAVFRGSNGFWYPSGSAAFSWGTTGDIPLPGQWDADLNTDAAIFRPNGSRWYVQGGPVVSYGLATDIPIPADYTGDGLADIAVYRPSNSTFYVLGQAPVQFGTAGDLPIPGQWDADPAIDFAIFRPTGNRFFVHGGGPSVGWGTTGDLPLPIDFDGDGLLDVTVYRKSSSTFYVKDQAAVQYGTNGDLPVPGQWDADPATDVAVYRASGTRWFVLGGANVAYGSPGDTPLVLPYHLRRLFP